MTDAPTVFVIDDDQAVRESLCWLVESIDLDVETYESADDFLASSDMIMKFPSVAKAQDWLNDPDYKKLVEHRHRSAKANLVLVGGID